MLHFMSLLLFNCLLHEQWQHLLLSYGFQVFCFFVPFKKKKKINLPFSSNIFIGTATIFLSIKHWWFKMINQGCWWLKWAFLTSAWGPMSYLVNIENISKCTEPCQKSLYFQVVNQHGYIPNHCALMTRKLISFSSHTNFKKIRF